MFLLREARLPDLDAILELAGHLQSPNLPADPDFLRARLERAERAFAEHAPPSADREYQFALVDEGDRVVGTCAILSKHGTPEMPHVYLRVAEEERASESADVRVRHQTLQLDMSTDGPSELGALILHPDARGLPGSPGKLLSWGRFAYMARHVGSFEPRVLAEMRANLDPEGKNKFWDAFGRRFTGMTYAEADRKSAEDKSFILDLFPDTPFYAALLDEEVEMELGQVHPEARPAVKLLERAGFYWVGEIDPFDAGPFYGAAFDEVIPIRDSVMGHVADGAPGDAARRYIATSESCGSFRAVVAHADVQGGELHLQKEALDRLGLAKGDELGLTPFPESRSTRGASHG